MSTRNMFVRALALSLGSAAVEPSPAFAQATQPVTPEQRMERLERRLDESERRHQQELRERDEEIARLRGQRPQPPAAATTAPGTSPDEIERTRQDVLRDIDRQSRPSFNLTPPASFNPDITVISDFLGTFSDRRENDALNRFDVREVELDLRAAVDPRADGVLVLAFERDVENPVFPDPDEPAEGPESSVSIEEAYLFLHDFGVPNLTAKVGRFHLRFGRQNMLHLHDLPTSDPPLVSQSFLSPESLADAGVSFSYVVPPRVVGGQYIEAIVEIISGEGAASESPTLAGDLSVDSPALNTHLLWNTDINRDVNVELGGSWLIGHSDADNSLDVNLFAVDATLMRRDPSGRFNNQLFQAEAIYGLIDTEDGGRNDAWGFYVLGQQQLKRDWYAGVRVDWTEDPLAPSEEAWAVSPYLSWYWSEFLRFRVQYQHREGDVPTENTVYFQLTWIFGAHPPHPYWAMR